MATVHEKVYCAHGKSLRACIEAYLFVAAFAVSIIIYFYYYFVILYCSSLIYHNINVGIVSSSNEVNWCVVYFVINQPN